MEILKLCFLVVSFGVQYATLLVLFYDIVLRL